MSTVCHFQLFAFNLSWEWWRHRRWLSDAAAGRSHHRRRTRARLTYSEMDDCSACDPIVTPGGGYFVLQLHDELIYEVTETDVSVVAGIIKHCMESATRLTVKLPVKLKAGPAWGTMTDLDLWTVSSSIYYKIGLCKMVLCTHTAVLSSTEWHCIASLCWCAVKKLLTHSLTTLVSVLG